MKLRTKFSLLIFLLVTSILTGVSIFLFLGEKKHLEQNLYEQLEKDINKFSKICSESILERGDITLLNYAKTIKTTKTIAYVIFMGPAGKILMHNDLSFRGLTFKSRVSLKTNTAEGIEKIYYKDPSGYGILEMVEPVYVGQVKAGVARIGYFQSELEKSINEMLMQTAQRIGKVAVIAIIVGILISYLLVIKMTGPINKLADGARIIGEGKLDHRIEIISKDELGHLSKEFNEMAKKLAELDRLKDEFVDNVSHELRSPLAAIRGYVQSLKRGVYGQVIDKQMEALDIIMSNAERLGKFIDDVLDMAKIKAGMLDLDKQETEFAPLASEIVKMFEPLSAEMGLKLGIEVPSNLPKIFVDPNKLKQVITNLTSNAMKFTLQGGTVTIIAHPQDENFIYAGVKDTGIGIPKDKISKVFEKFTQVKEAQQTSKKIKGTGLGLTIAKNIVELHGGKIWIESEAGKGTTFFFTIPRKELSAEG